MAKGGAAPAAGGGAERAEGYPLVRALGSIGMDRYPAGRSGKGKAASGGPGWAWGSRGSLQGSNGACRGEEEGRGCGTREAKARPLELREGEAEKGVKPTSDPGDGRREGPGIYSPMREEEEEVQMEEGGIPSQDRNLHSEAPRGAKGNSGPSSN